MLPKQGVADNGKRRSKRGTVSQSGYLTAEELGSAFQPCVSALLLRLSSNWTGDADARIYSGRWR
jgi:hypothetical protein